MFINFREYFEKKYSLYNTIIHEFTEIPMKKNLDKYC